MARPKPTIIMEHVDSSYRAEQILEADNIYAVFYKGQPINVRTTNHVVTKQPKYRKSSFSNSGHAFNLAERLNKMFKTDEFEVFILNQGTKITETKEPA